MISKIKNFFKFIPNEFSKQATQKSNRIPTFNIGNHIFNKEINFNSLFQHDMYVFQKGFFKDSTFVYDGDKSLIFYVEKKKTNIVDDIRIIFNRDKITKNEVLETDNFIVFSDKSKANELLRIDGSIENYIIYDTVINKNIGYIKQKSELSIKNEWIFYSINDQIIGKMNERSTIFSIINTLMGFIYSFIGIGAWLIPQTYDITSSDGMDVAKIKKQFNLFTFKYNATLNILQINPTIDQRLLISMGILIIKE